MNQNISKKFQIKPNNLIQKSGVIYRQPIIQDIGLRNKINLPNPHLQSSKDKNKDLAFDPNPMIVTRRNISTAQTKNNNNEGDDDDLLFTSMNLRKREEPAYKSRFGQTFRQQPKKMNDRPHSKQQPRNKCWNNSQILIKSTVPINDRPLTSKGQRPKLSYKSKIQQGGMRKISLGNQQPKNVKNQQLMASNNFNTSKTSKLFFKTSIDSQFLSLFAN